jgi:hypothetical protein
VYGWTTAAGAMASRAMRLRLLLLLRHMPWQSTALRSIKRKDACFKEGNNKQKQ